MDSIEPYSSHCNTYDRGHAKLAFNTCLGRLSQLVVSGDKMQLEQSRLIIEGKARAFDKVAWAGKAEP